MSVDPDDKGDPAIPAPGLLFPIVRDHHGPRLALVFGNHALAGECPFYRGNLCHHCDIGAGEGTRFDLTMNRRRLQWFVRHYSDVLPTIAHLVVYNSGSVLNPSEMPAEFLEEVLRVARELPTLRAVSIDSRESFVTDERVARFASALRPDQRLRVILGLESADDRIRDELLEKRMSRSAVERAIAEIAKLENTGLDVNLVVGGPGTADDPVSDARGTARYVLQLTAPLNLPVDFNLHPYYPSRRGLARFPNHSRPSLETVIEATAAVLDEIATFERESSVFLGLHDEGHDLRAEERASFIQLRERLDEFHAHQHAARLQGGSANER